MARLPMGLTPSWRSLEQVSVAVTVVSDSEVTPCSPSGLLSVPVKDERRSVVSPSEWVSQPRHSSEEDRRANDFVFRSNHHLTQ